MSYKHILPLLLVTFMSCEKEDATTQLSPCQSPYGPLRRQEFIQNKPAIVVQRSQKNGESSFQLIPVYSPGVDEANHTPWGSCNLGAAFQQDSLRVTVSGYFLTSDQLETMNVSPLPFEVTGIQLRN